MGKKKNKAVVISDPGVLVSADSANDKPGDVTKEKHRGESWKDRVERHKAEEDQVFTVKEGSWLWRRLGKRASAGLTERDIRRSGWGRSQRLLKIGLIKEA